MLVLVVNWISGIYYYMTGNTEKWNQCYYINLPDIHVSMFSSFNRALVAASRQQRPAKPSGVSHRLQQHGALTESHGRLLFAILRRQAHPVKWYR